MFPGWFQAVEKDIFPGCFGIHISGFHYPGSHFPGNHITLDLSPFVNVKQEDRIRQDLDFFLPRDLKEHIPTHFFPR